mmetsp:Transcript_6832/g.16769  ORF Transcript_6832/g.16769 Transcript_6832/m.16769 type:complete len:288 (-) Transcript_6832:145-1008(-)
MPRWNRGHHHDGASTRTADPTGFGSFLPESRIFRCSIHSRWFASDRHPDSSTGTQSVGIPCVIRAYLHSWSVPWWIRIRSRMNLHRVTMTMLRMPTHWCESVHRWYPTGRAGTLRGTLTISRASVRSKPPFRWSISNPNIPSESSVPSNLSRGTRPTSYPTATTPFIWLTGSSSMDIQMYHSARSMLSMVLYFIDVYRPNRTDRPAASLRFRTWKPPDLSASMSSSLRSSRTMSLTSLSSPKSRSLVLKCRVSRLAAFFTSPSVARRNMSRKAGLRTYEGSFESASP